MAGRRRLMFAKDFTVDYFKFTALESGTFTLTIGQYVTTSDLSYVEYSIDDGETWTKTDNVASTTVTITTPTISTGDSVLWRGSGVRTSQESTSIGTTRYSVFSSTCQCNVSGDVNTLLGLSSPNNVTVSTYMYRGLFYEMSTLVEASQLILPSTASSQCFRYMFYGCTSLTSAPNLPATTLGANCYQYMFNGCSSLTTAPALPATTLANYCYSNMFYGCTSLVNVPNILPATTLANYCYSNMFKDCSNITTAPILPAMSLNNNYCYDYMFDGCSKLNYVKAYFTTTPGYYYTQCWLRSVASTGTFVKHPLATWDLVGVTGVPSGWTIQYDTSLITQFNPQYTFTPAGYLTFTHSGTIYFGLANKCSYHTIYVSKNGTDWHNLQATDCLEFVANENCYVCGSLTNAASASNYTKFVVNGSFSISGNCNALWDYTNLSTTLRNYCGFYLFRDCKSLVNAQGLTLPSLTLSGNCYNYMFYGCTNLISAPALPATTLASYCYQRMFQNCTSLTTAPSLPATTLAQSCYGYMFYNCTSLATAPQLPATTLASSCYGNMFQGCTSLTTAPVLSAKTLENSCYNYMFSGCTSLNYVKALFTTDISGSSSYTDSWLNNVAQTGTFTKHPLADWERSDSTGIPINWTVQYDSDSVTEFNPQYTFTPSGYVTFSHSEAIYLSLERKSYNHTVYVSKNGSNWHSLQETDALEFASNENCYVCGNLISSQSSSDFTQIKCRGSFSISGNCNTLWNYTDLSASLKTYCGYYLFGKCKGLTSASGLTLPSLTATTYCYGYMFNGCTSLINPPTISAASTADYCFRSMFENCTSLTMPPTIPLTNYSLARDSFHSMFMGCTSLTSTTCIDYSSITTAKDSALAAMFRGCTTLTTTPTSIGTVSTTIEPYCFMEMFYGCTNIENVPSLPYTTLVAACYRSMFYQCSNITTAPELPAETLYSECYSAMFRYCTKLNYVKALFTTTPSSTYTSYWLVSVASSGIFVKNINATWTTTGNNGIPSTWTVIYYDPDDEKYYTDRNKTTECDDHGNPL